MKRRSFLALAAAPLAFSKDTLVADAAALRAAIRAAAPGDVIVMKDGAWSDCDIVFDVEGTAEKPITLRAQTPGKVVLSGKSHLRVGGRHLVADGLDFRGTVDGGDIIDFRVSGGKLARNCRVTRCAVREAVPAGGEKRSSRYASLYGLNNRLDHCYFAGKTTLGTTVVVWLRPQDGPNAHSIDHNHFGPRPPLGENGGETIRVGDSTTSMSESKTLVVDNYFEHCSGEVEIISNKSCGNIYRGNVFFECEGTLTLRHGNACLVEGNFFLGNGKRHTGGVRIIGEDHRVVNNVFEHLRGTGARAALSMMNGMVDSPLYGYYQVKRAAVEGNTFSDCDETFTIGVRGSTNPTLAPRECRIARNIVVGKKGPLVRLLAADAAIDWKDNCFAGTEVGLAGVNVSANCEVRRPVPPDTRTCGPDWPRA